MTRRSHGGSKERSGRREGNFRALIEQSADVILLVGATGKVTYCSESARGVLGYRPQEIEGADVFPQVHPDDAGLFAKRWRQLLKRDGASDMLEYRVRHKDGSWIWVETAATNHIHTADVGAVVCSLRDISQHKAVEQRLRESEEQYRRLSDLSPDGIVVHAQGRLLYANAAAAQLIGAASTEALIGQPLMQFVHPDYIESVKQRVRTIMVEHRPTELIEEKFIRVDGRVIDVEAISIPFQYHDEPAVQVVIRDITERKRAVEALRASEERLRFMAESMPQKVFTATPAGDIDYYNPQWLEYTGLPAGEIDGWGWMRIVHPDDRELSLRHWRHSLTTGEPFSTEQRFRRHDGMYRWHISRALPMRNHGGVIIRWFGSNTDIHDIKAALEREHQLEARAVLLTEQREQLVALGQAKDEFIALASHQLRTPATAVKQYLGMLAGGYAGELNDAQAEMVDLANQSNERQISIINDLLEVARVDSGKVQLHHRKVDVTALVRHVIDEQRQAIGTRGQTITSKTGTATLYATIDETKIRMVLENLISNASKYSRAETAIQVTVRSSRLWVSVSVTDHGVGIAAADRDKLFRKFSRIDNPLSVEVGGTGLGLYWAKRIVDLHGGEIAVRSTLHKGSTFTVRLPRRTASQSE